jgi:phage replication O-like protein O
MASPQCENGYTKIANELFEAILRTRLPGQELRIMLSVLRFTYGFGKKQDQISYGQLSKITNIPRKRVIEHFQSLISKNFLGVVPITGLGSPNHGTRTPRTMWINKDFEKWEPSPLKGTSPNHGTIPSPNHVPNLVPITGPSKERKKKEKEIIPTILPEWLEKELWDDFIEHRKKLRKPMTKRAEDTIIKKLTWLKGLGHNPRHCLLTAIERGWLSVFEPKEGV